MMFDWQLSADNEIYYLEGELFIVLTIINNPLNYSMNICVFQHIAYAIIMPNSTVKGCCIIPDSLNHGVIAEKQWHSESFPGPYAKNLYWPPQTL